MQFSTVSCGLPYIVLSDYANKPAFSNPIAKESSVSPNFNLPPDNHQSTNGNYSSTCEAPSRAISYAFKDLSKLQNDPFNLVHRSQSLSAAEFLRRHAPANNESTSAATVGGSLRRFSSQLRTHKLSTVGLESHPSLSTLYTPPPMLSPQRAGSGMYRSISRQGKG